MAIKKTKAKPKKRQRKLKIPGGVEPLHPSVQRIKKRAPDGLRLQALAVYVMDMEGCSIQDLHKDPRFNHLSYDTLRTWAHEDGWTLLRKEAMEKVKVRLATELQFRLSENLMREVHDLMELRQQVWTHLKGTPPKSWEGVAKIFLDVNKSLRDLAEMVKEGAIDDVGRRIPQAQQGTDDAGLKPDELKVIAGTALAKKRSELRAKLVKHPIQLPGKTS